MANYHSCPLQSGEKTALAIAILVSQTLYFTLVIEVIPATSLTLPLLGRQPPPPTDTPIQGLNTYII
jgi:hypothetical protein